MFNFNTSREVCAKTSGAQYLLKIDFTPCVYMRARLTVPLGKGNLEELLIAWGTIQRSGVVLQRSVALASDKEDWVLSVDSVSSLSVSFCTGAFSV